MNPRTFQERYNPETLGHDQCKSLYADWTHLMWSALDLKRPATSVDSHPKQDISVTFFQAAEKCQRLTSMDLHFPDQSQYRSTK